MLTSNATIFVIDDDEAVCDSLRLLLGLHGLNVVVYGSTEEFLRDRPDGNDRGKECILLDLDVPGMSGIEFLGLLRRRRSPVPVIVITGRGAAASAQARDAGAVAVLEKPFFNGALMACVDRALAREAHP